ncbi:MAG: methyltransferase domain-containing protein [Alphaproteobacteria bacterium]|nr:methyltransferase domain-containing protein [Alphaproteobacteria bacterium]
MNRRQRRAAQAQVRSAPAAVASTPRPPSKSEAARLSADAFAHHRAGRLTDAEAAYRKALALDPSLTSCLQNLGVIALDAGRAGEARDAFERVLAREPGHLHAHIGLGKVHRSEGRSDDAIACYLRAIELRPDQMDAHNELCSLLLSLSRHAAVASHFEQILAVRPDYVPGYNTLAVALLGAGDAPRAIEAVLNALRREELQESRALFLCCIQYRPSAIPQTEEMRGLLIRAMSEPWGRPSDLTRHAARLIKSDPAIAADIAAAAAAWPERLAAARLYANRPLTDVARDALLRCLLENARSDDVALERYLTSARRTLLDAACAAAPDASADADILAFHAALARQCFFNEYAFAVADDEAKRHAALKETTERELAGGRAVPAIHVAALAAYEPLHRLQHCAALLGSAWPEPVAALLAQQITEPEAERRIAAALPRLTPIEDEVSVLVQAQYEENPYPRWRKAAPASRPTPIDERLRNQFPGAPFRSTGSGAHPEVLVAGCGTGQQLVDVAQRIAGARVLAVDLSAASLAYAKRQTDALGLRNIEYGQADILKLGTIGRRFDVIDCGGVLHHLRDPLEGWRVLLSLLKPDGAMRIALYSELARPHIVAARDFVAARGYGRTAGDIRRFRQDVLALPEGDLVRLVAESPDFFSVSDCRDLVFHVQEHRFTLPQIAAFLDEAGLAFLGFETDVRVLGRYGERFPDEPTRTDLRRWHAFERDNPTTFSGMYQFWVQRRAP